MDFDLTTEQQGRIDAIRASAAALSLLEPGTAGGRDLWRAAAKLGMTGLCLPAAHGGLGLDALDTALSLEAFADAGGNAGLAFGIAAHLLACGMPIAEHAQEEIRLPMLLGLSSGTLIAANAMTEDGAGSDITQIATTAVQDGDTYILNGVKSFVSNGPLADIFVTYAMTTPGAGFLGISAFAVPRDLPGIVVSDPLEKLGLVGCTAARVTFDECRVPRMYLMGVENQGRKVFERSMTWERACLPAIFVGVMEAQLRRCVSHARERRQFGRRIGDFQAVSHRLALMKQRLESSRCLLYRACCFIDSQNLRAGDAAALAKAAVADAAVANSLDAVQLFGGRGYLAADGIGQQLLDAIPMHLFSGTTDIQRELVAKGLGV
jgi:L-prolyl-[peptidyl-carrier protein] dehydrogenase